MQGAAAGLRVEGWWQHEDKWILTIHRWNFTKASQAFWKKAPEQLSCRSHMGQMASLTLLWHQSS